jgi:hypothetical protein
VRTAILVLAGMLAGAWGCDGTSGGTDDGTPADVATPETVAGCSGEAAMAFSGDMTGRWVQVQERAAMVEMLPSSPGERLTRTWFVVDVTQVDGVLEATYVACAVDVESPEGGTSTTIPAALIASLGPSTRPAVLSRDGGGWRFAQSDHVELRGVRDLTDPANDELPLDPQDARIFDQDGDAQPGVTVFVDGSGINLEVYVAQRIVTALDGTVVADGCFEGTVAWSEDQAILGGVGDPGQEGILDALLKRPDIAPTAEGNRFRMTRVGGDLAAGDAADACDAMLADRARWGW